MTGSSRRKRPTIIDVAQYAGVSHTTVSFVINGVTSAGISPDTRARVLEAITQLDYHPHAGARSMGRRAARTIGITIPDSINPHYHEIAAGVEAYAAEQGYNVLRASTNFDPAREQLSLQSLKEQQIDGLILIPSTSSSLDMYANARLSYQQPIVLLGTTHSDFDTVETDSASGERQLLEHLAGLGHRRIGYIYGVADQSSYGQRLETCLQLQRSLGLPVVDEWVRRCGPTVEDGYRATDQLLASCGASGLPSALIVVNDLLAAAVVAALTVGRVRIPDMISVAAFDNTVHARYTIVPTLTSVDQESHVVGQTAARLLLARLAEPQLQPEHVTVRAKLVVRASTGPAPSA